ncbi:hypothetical protein [Clostridium ganghwense]|uniref:DUF5673 domain-containing protein n=1 Tax=Clostridium ganghwense TaxID=312089 RepID=A0ABT4CT25_9CLOT|nr:hypothetical protein [Clostridium ganghwense]MCY6372202.1 hypothetical protein [Clostridium ganghwense]
MFRFISIIKENKKANYIFDLRLDKGNKRLIIILITIMIYLLLFCIKGFISEGLIIFDTIKPIILLQLINYTIKFKRKIGVTKEGIVYCFTLIKWEDIENYEFKDCNLLIINYRWYFSFERNYYNDIYTFLKMHLNI